MPFVHRRMLIATAVAAALAGTSIAWSSADAATGVNGVSGLPAAATQNVIVLLRDQHTNLTATKSATSPRAQAMRRDQAPVLSSARSMGVRNLHGYSLINGFSATVTGAQASQLAANPAVAAVLPDVPVARPQAPVRQGAGGSVPARTDTATICPADPSKPLLEPEALQTTHTAFLDPATPSAQRLVDGAGVKVAWLADGIDINDPDFIRADGSHVIVDYQDFSGEGRNAPSDARESFGDASSIAAQGRQVYDISTFMTPADPIPTPCDIAIRGMAPGASLVGLKVFGNSPSTPTSRIIDAIQYAVNVAHVDVINESFGAPLFPDTDLDPTALADDAAVSAGITVVSGTSDAGTAGTVTTPSSDPNIISVAATTNYRVYEQEGLLGTYPGANGTWTDDNISPLSGGGETLGGRVTDLAAPGDSGWALCSPNIAIYQGCTSILGNVAEGFQDFGGTSQSSPLVAGAAALVIEAYEHTHDGVRPSPALVKRLLTSTATDLGHPSSEQGAGEVNSLEAVNAAMSWHDTTGAPKSTSDAIIASPNQSLITGQPGQHVTDSLTLTNLAGKAQTVHLGTREIGKTLSRDFTSLTLNTSSAPPSPTFLDGFGTTRSYVKRTINVPAGADRLDVSVAADTPVSFIRFVLLDPHGRLTQYTVPQGNGNFGHADVRFPAPGKWSAVVYVARTSGFNGAVAYSATTERFASAGSVSPSTLSIGAGQTQTVTVHSTLASHVGDVAASVQVTRDDGIAVSVPLVARTLIPTSHPTNTFAGVVTGGNGRAFLGTAQSDIYSMDVPAGKKDMTIDVTLAEPGDAILGVLSRPNGQVASSESDLQPEPDGSLGLFDSYQLHVRDPEPGRWSLTFVVLNPVSGDTVALPFTAKVRFNAAKVTATLPDSAATTLAAGVPVTVPVKITNTGDRPQTYFADGRLDTTADYQLADQSGAPQPFDLPTVTPQWVVPPSMSRAVFSAIGSEGVNLIMQYTTGDPELFGGNANNKAAVAAQAPNLSAGFWFADIGQVGPFSGPAPAGTVTAAATVHGLAFDPAVNTGGDLWLGAIEGPADAALAAQLRSQVRYVPGHAVTARTHPATAGGAAPAVTPTAGPTGPITLDPGQTATMNVVITPSGTHGSVVSGHLYVDTFDRFVGAGDELIGLPYRYTVG